jgi:DNA-binding response OmpR family regulator
MRNASDDPFRESLRQLAEGYAAIIAHYDIAHYERTIALLAVQLSRPAHQPARPSRVGRSRTAELRVLDETLTVAFREQRCFLGNTIPLKLFRRLLAQRNQFIRHDDLLRQVWEVIRAPSTIRSAVKILRRQLREAGMKNVADAIDGRIAGHYGLMIDRLK